MRRSWRRRIAAARGAGAPHSRQGCGRCLQAARRQRLPGRATRTFPRRRSRAAAADRRAAAPPPTPCGARSPLRPQTPVRDGLPGLLRRAAFPAARPPTQSILPAALTPKHRAAGLGPRRRKSGRPRLATGTGMAAPRRAAAARGPAAPPLNRCGVRRRGCRRGTPLLARPAARSARACLARRLRPSASCGPRHGPAIDPRCSACLEPEPGACGGEWRRGWCSGQRRFVSG